MDFRHDCVVLTLLPDLNQDTVIFQNLEPVVILFNFATKLGQLLQNLLGFLRKIPKVRVSRLCFKREDVRSNGRRVKETPLQSLAGKPIPLSDA